MDGLFSAAAAAYRRGREVPLDETSGREENLRLLLTLAARLPFDDVLAFRQCTEVRERGLAAARRGDLGEARALLGEARRLLLLQPRSDEVLTLDQAYHEPAEAYVQYRARKLHRARLSLLRGLAATERLESRYGYDFLEARRIHLVRNLVRAEVVQGRFSSAEPLVLGLLSYLCGLRQAWPLPTEGDGLRFQSMDEDLEERMAGQVAGEAALLLAMAGDAEAPGLCERARAAVAAPVACVVLPWRRHLAAWLESKSARLRGEPERFLQEAPAVLERGRGRLALVWHAAVLDLYLCCCEATAYPRVLELARELEHDTSAYPYLPAGLKLPASSEPGRTFCNVPSSSLASKAV